MPKYIPLTKDGYDLLELFGGYFCEGFKARKIRNHLDRLSYSSSEVDQIEWFINSMNIFFGIRKSEWDVQILLRNYNKEIHSYIVNYWADSGLEKEKIKIINNNLVNGKFGVCLVNIYNSTLAETMYEVFMHCKSKALKNKKYSLSFFRGLSRGDMGVSITHKKNLLTFTTEKEENITFFTRICGNLGIRTGKSIRDNRGKNGCWKISIHNFNSFLIVAKLKAITHDRRKYYFYTKFLGCKGSTPFKYLKAISQGFNTKRKVSEHLGLSIITIGMTLSNYSKMNLLIKTVRNFGGGYQTYYSLSKKGQDLLDFYKDIEKETINNNI